MQEELKLDSTIQSPQERIKLVQKILEATPAEKLTNRYLQILSTYIIMAMTKEERKSKKINTDNRMVTINKRETSFQGLVSKFENGEDGIYNMIVNDKNILLTPKIKITQKDIAEIPELRQLRQAIAKVEKAEKVARGKKKYFLKKQLIEMWKDQYVIKMAYKPPIYCLNANRNFSVMDFYDDITILKDGTIKDQSLIALTNPTHISALLCNYSKFKQDSYGRFYTDSYYLIQDLETLIDTTLKEKYPLYFKLLIYKIDGKSNVQIQTLLQREFKIRHSIEYISCLWRNKIPKLLADQAEKNYLEWYFTEKEKGNWKKCSRCGQIKLAHNKFFSKNSSSRDGFYSICKQCRNKKNTNTSNKIIKRISYKKDKNE